jgi:hypothetical protein
LKPQSWGSPFVQEEKYQEKPVKREENNNNDNNNNNNSSSNVSFDKIKATKFK